MAIPSGSLKLSYDFSNPACYSGSGSTVYDLTLNNVNATITNATYVSDGSASHFNFNGTNAVITSNLYNQSSKTVMTYNCWGLYSSTAVGYMFITGLGTLGPSGGGSPVFAVNEATANEYRFNFGYGYGAVTAPSYINQWAMLTITADGTTVKFYINGVLVDTASQGVAQIDSGPQRTRLGAYDTSGGFFAGKIATFDYYNVALEAADILSIYNSTRSRFDTLVASYDFSDPLCYPGTGNTVFDISGNNNNLALFNSPTFGGSGQSQTLTFNGTTQYGFRNSPIIGLSNTFTYNIWAKFPSTTDPATYNLAFAYGSEFPSSNWTGLFNNRLNSEITFSTGGISGINLETAVTPNLVDFYNIIVTNDGSGSNNLKVYINGALNATGTFALNFEPSAVFSLASNIALDGKSNISVGLVEFYNTALGSTAVTALYNSQQSRFIPPSPPVTPVLIGSYDFSDPACWPGSGNTAYDLTAENNDLLLNIVSFGGTGQSKFASLNGDTSWMYKGQFSASGSTFNSDQFTISVWHNYGTQGTFGGVSYIVMGGVTAFGQGPSIVVDNSDQKVRGVFGAEITAGGWVTGIANTNNTWHMTTLVGDGTNFLLYQDGALTGSTTQNGQWGGSNLVFGRPSQFPTGPAQGSFGHKWGGLLGIAEVYSGALGSTDISDLYDLQQPRFYTPTPPPPSPLVASYDFSDPLCYPGTGNTVFDLTANNLDLPIVNATYGGTGQSKYFEFSGGSSYIGKTGVSGLGTSFSISIWSQTSVTSSSNQVTFFAGNDGISSSAPAFYYNIPTIGEISASFNYGTGLITEPYVLDTWENYVYTADGTTVKFYKNGVEVGSVSQGPGNWPNGQFYLGYTADALIGKIATLDVYNTALGSTAVSTFYNNTENRFLPAPPPAPPSIVGGRQFAQGFNG